MLRNRLLLYFVFASALFAGCAVKAKQNQYERLYFAVLDAQVVAQKGGDYHTMDRVFELGRAGRDANHYVVDLLDYYLGAAAGEILQELITSKGGNIVPLLKQKREGPLSCLSQYKAICADSLEHRNHRIDEMLEAIRKGVVLKAAE